ncbi:MAG: PQQ-binding-like beta-propeller repeat protein, partial [Thermomicrobiales bacterium]
MRVIRLLVLALVMVLPWASVRPGLAQEATPGASPPAGASLSADWPQFRANPEHTGTALGPGPGDAPVVRWRVENGGGLASPAVADGVVYVGGWGNYVFALDAQTGAEHWRFPAASRVPSPAVSGSLVMVGSFDGLHALD